MITAWHLICIGFGLAWCLLGEALTKNEYYDDELARETLFMLIVFSIFVYLMFVAFSHKDFLSSIIIF